MKGQQDILEFEALQKVLAELRTNFKERPEPRLLRVINPSPVVPFDQACTDTDTHQLFEVMAMPVGFCDGKGEVTWRWKIKTEFVL